MIHWIIFFFRLTPENRRTRPAVEIPHQHRPADRLPAPGNAGPVTRPHQRSKPMRNAASAARTPL